MGCPWDNREMFERYVYDYLMKNGKGEIAEIFRCEANLPFDPMSPPAIDVPDGFLHEWWLIFHEIFKGWKQNNSNNNEGSSYMAKEMVNVKIQQGDPSQSREQEMNEEMIRELTGSSDFALTIVDNSILESVQTSQGLTSQPQQTSLADSKRHCQPVDLSDIIALRVCSSSCETLETKKVAPAESGRKSKNSTGSGYGSNSVPVAADCPSETSSPICKSFDKLSHSPDSGNKDEGKTSSSDSRTNHATADTKTSKVKGSRHF
ncbi:hypothetical protein RHSIM_Rhsim13G0074000 [Rhododendron simsii]|uniref:LisH domain-containing protein n=1 Tax=Rhododendron simsii TaxID=118357 RepID=A0A834FXP3_RHOSS|nr:hypothetical protein RHSIM_Rhsim13G0074000 [Rhododendron simsii]